MRFHVSYFSPKKKQYSKTGFEERTDKLQNKCNSEFQRCRGKFIEEMLAQKNKMKTKILITWILQFLMKGKLAHVPNA